MLVNLRITTSFKKKRKGSFYGETEEKPQPIEYLNAVCISAI